MIYSLPENPTREDIRREYTIVNMRFKELQAQMEPHHKREASRLLGYVRDDLRQKPNPEGIPEHTQYSLMLAEGIISKYRGETKEDLRVAEGLCRELSIRHIDLVRSVTPIDRRSGSYISIALNALDDVDHQHPDTYTRAIDKVMHSLAEAEKLIIQAEKRPVPAGVV